MNDSRSDPLASFALGQDWMAEVALDPALAAPADVLEVAGEVGVVAEPVPPDVGLAPGAGDFPAIAAEGGWPSLAGAGPTGPDLLAPPPPAVPSNFIGFCLGCGYNLRGLAEPRCPECGRRFRPGNSATYAATPGGGPGRSSDHSGHAWTAAVVANAFPWSAGTMLDRVAWLERRVRQLSAANRELDGIVRTLVDVLVARGVLTADDLFEIVPPDATDDPDAPAADGSAVDALAQVTDDTPLIAEPDIESAALRELQRAVG